jgi:hypothetical protein
MVTVTKCFMILTLVLLDYITAMKCMSENTLHCNWNVCRLQCNGIGLRDTGNMLVNVGTQHMYSSLTPL